MAPHTAFTAQAARASCRVTSSSSTNIESQDGFANARAALHPTRHELVPTSIASYGIPIGLFEQHVYRCSIIYMHVYIPNSSPRATISMTTVWVKLVIMAPALTATSG